MILPVGKRVASPCCQESLHQSLIRGHVEGSIPSPGWKELVGEVEEEAGRPAGPKQSHGVTTWDSGTNPAGLAASEVELLCGSVLRSPETMVVL